MLSVSTCTSMIVEFLSDGDMTARCLELVLVECVVVQDVYDICLALWG